MFLLLTSVFLTSDTRWLPLGWLKFAFWLSAVSQKQNKTKQKNNKISCPPVFAEKKKKKKNPRESSRLGNIYGRLEPQETSRGKCSLSFSGPSLPPRSLLSFLPTLNLGAESLRKVKGELEKSTDDSQMD